MLFIVVFFAIDFNKDMKTCCSRSRFEQLLAAMKLYCVLVKLICNDSFTSHSTSRLEISFTREFVYKVTLRSKIETELASVVLIKEKSSTTMSLNCIS